MGDADLAEKESTEKKKKHNEKKLMKGREGWQKGQAYSVKVVHLIALEKGTY